ncbi:hypothetical protein ACI2K4_35165 [Micromonospora sp. NPDC050397]|uniref:hypothetical protein n=1 Tax=Micromonospora sp. NPDC050397 TaxID=3364279 RepID=UPI00384EF892
MNRRRGGARRRLAQLLLVLAVMMGTVALAAPPASADAGDIGWSYSADAGDPGARAWYNSSEGDVTVCDISADGWAARAYLQYYDVNTGIWFQDVDLRKTNFSGSGTSTAPTMVTPLPGVVNT